MSKNRNPIKELHELSRTDLTFKELCERYPEMWKQLEVELKSTKRSAQQEFVNKTMQLFKHHQQRIQKNPQDPRLVSVSLPHLIRARLLMLAMENMTQALQKDANLRFGIIGGRVFSRLLFKDGKPKPASWFWTRFWLRLLPSRKDLLPVAQSKGIQCFYSKGFVNKVAKIVEGMEVLEIGAGTGDLTRFLSAKGVSIRATDDYSWEKFITYPEFVEKLDAASALRQYQPKAVICAWSPFNNVFESKVFESTSVDLYISIGTRAEAACFNQRVYHTQKDFEWKQDLDLAAQILPSTGEWMVHVFKRIK